MLEPIERNAFLRVQAVDTPVNAVFALELDGTDYVWAVGDGGLIIRSADGGRTWVQQNPPPAAGEPRRNPPVGAWRWPSLVEPAFAVQAAEKRQQQPNEPDVGQKTATTLKQEPVAPAPHRARPSDADRRSPRLLGVAFADSGRGMAWSRNVVLETEDGGTSWRIAAESEVEILDVGFAGRSRWMLDGSVLWRRGDDNLDEWRPYPLPRSLAAASLRFVDETSGWMVHSGLWVTSDGGRHWKERDFPGYPFHLWISGPREARITTRPGSSFVTGDRASTWTPAELPLDTEGYLTEAGPGIGVSLSGDRVSWSDRGRTLWRSGPTGLQVRADDGDAWRSVLVALDVQSLRLTSALEGWAAFGENLLETSDGGETWSAAEGPAATSDAACPLHFAGKARGDLRRSRCGALMNGAPADTRAAWLVDAERGFAVTPEGIVATMDGGNRWPLLHAKHDLRDVAFSSDGQQGWAVGDRGRIYATTDGGKTWVRRKIPTEADLNGVYFLDTRQGFAVGANSTLLETRDGGGTWTLRPLADPVLAGLDLRTLHFFDAENGWLAAGTTLLRTSDGGASWERVRYARYPAPWYWLVCIGAVALVWPRRREEDAIVSESVADVLASDRPIGWSDPDPLRFGDIALGISRFIRNQSTEPPLTIAITGQWGSGKSSLMTLLKEDLARRGFRPVWFNAWHHQKGENLLAALSANILEQSVPGVFTPRGLWFRVTLVWLRSWRRRAVAGVVAFAAMFLVGYLAAKPGRGAALLALLPSADELAKMSSLDDVVTTTAKALTVLVPSFAGLVPLWRSLRAFGVDPTKLKDSTDRAGAANDPAARHRFAREFNEVTRALHPRTMVIFIDDLDRCSKEHVVEVLEAINYLVSSGECVVVFAMAREWVESCVALAFEELSKQTPIAPGAKPEQRDLDFARNYLEKLINIEVPVPALDEKRSEEFYQQRGAGKTSWRKWLAKWAPDGVAALLVLGLAIAGAWVGGWIELPVPPARPAPSPPLREVLLSDGTLQVALPLRTEKSKGADGEALVLGEVPLAGEVAAALVIARDEAGQIALQLEMPTAAAPAAPVTPPAEEVEGPSRAPIAAPLLWQPAPLEPSSSSIALAVMALLAVGLAVALELATSLRVVEKDSDDFRDALAVWHKVIIAKKPTPRTLKRYLNRVRYLAMRLRTEPEPLGWLARLRARWRVRGTRIKPKPSSPSDPNLVALAALHLHDPRNLDTESLQVLFSQRLRSIDNIADDSPIQKSARGHLERFHKAPSEEDRTRFLEILAAVQAN